MKFLSDKQSRTKFFLASLAALAAGTLGGFPAGAATYTWDPSANRSDAGGSGTWSTTAGNTVWDSGAADVVWPNTGTDGAIFGGADGTYAVTVANGILAGTATFNASGYTLSGASAASPGTLTMGTTTGALNVAAGKSMTIGSNLTVTLPGGATLNAPTADTGTINITGGSVGGALLYVEAGTLNVGTGGSLTTSSSLAIGNDPTRTASLTVNGGTVTPSALVIGGNAGSSNPSVTLNSGSITVGGSPGVRFGSGTVAINSTFNLNGGTLSVTSLGNAAATGPTSTFNFNGGTLQSRSSTYGATFFSQTGFAVNNLVVQAGGAKIDTQSYNMTITPSLVHDSTLGATADGGLNKIAGTGTLTLAAANSYTGGTTVTAGILAVTANGALGSGNVTVLSTATSLTLTGTTNAISDTATLTLQGGGTAGVADNGYLNLGTGVTETVGTLVLGTTTYTSGTFTAAAYPEYFSGTGTLFVGAVPEPGTWAGILALGTFGAMTLRARAVRRG